MRDASDNLTVSGSGDPGIVVIASAVPQEQAGFGRGSPMWLGGPSRGEGSVASAARPDIRWFHGTPVVRVACGIGVEQCAISLKKLFEMQVVRFLVFVGFAGGVSPEWGVGDVVWVDRVVGSDGAVNRIRPTPVDKVRLTHDVRRGTVVTTARVASTRQSKAALLEAWGSHDVVAVDMESSAVALTANAYGVDCVILRAISDTYDHDIPEEAIRAIASDGRVDLAVLLRGCLLRPGAVCDLVRLGIASRRASRRLAKVALQVLGSLRAAEASGSN